MPITYPTSTMLRVAFLDPVPQFWRFVRVCRFVLTRSFSKGAAAVHSDGYVFIRPTQRPLHSITMTPVIYV